MKAGPPLSEIQSVRTGNPAHGGTVVSHEQGEVVFVHYALPGEVVEIERVGRRGGASFAQVTQVQIPSPDRVTASCPHFGSCGGCQWQHAAYPRQLAVKRQVVADIWERSGLRLPPDASVHGMTEPWRYRIRGEFEVTHGQGLLQMGFHRMRSHAVLPIETCPIHDERIERGMLAFRDAARRLGVQGLVSLQLTAEPQGKGLLWRTRYQRPGQADQNAALAHEAAGMLSDLVLLDDSISLDFWDLRFRVRSDTFIQTNYSQMLVLYQIALDMLDVEPGSAVLDLYAGIGTLSLAIARRDATVTAVEANPGAVNLAVLAARINAIKGVRFLAGATEQVLRDIRIGEHESALLDPPRAGCEPAAIAELLRLSPPRLVYVSCEPSTHARDIALLVRGGYRVRRAALVDMFPQTYHVETVALLERLIN
jgi:23S rRNA (uracil1939-C5)-methyltransferase